MAMADGGEQLSYDDIPWPVSEREETRGDADGAAAALRAVLLSGVVDDADVRPAGTVRPAASGGARRALRSEMLRWHPDKFEARLGRHVRASDRERVAARVNVVAQLVAQLFKRTAAG